MKKAWKATFLITLEGADSDRTMTAQMARDKLLVPLQEMWILGHVNHVAIKEIEPMKIKSSLEHENKQGKRESFYTTGFPMQKKRRK